MSGYPRREFVLQVLAACGSSLLVPSVLFGSGVEQSPAGAGPSARAATAYFGSRTESARAVGVAYLRQLGHDAGPSSIAAATRDTTTVIERAASEPEAVAALVAAVRSDFQEGRSVQVEGWVLSRTEAELCVLTLLPETN
jgi:hypothetical protein